MLRFSAALLVFAFPAACFAQAAPPIPASAPASGGDTTLDLTLQTGPAPGTAAPKLASLPPMGTGGLSPRAMSALASRHADFDRASVQKKTTVAASAPSVTATLGLVLPASASLRISQASNSRLLNTVRQGTYLAVVADGGTHWGVLMVNNTMGWVSKSSLQMIDYQTQVSLPAQVPSSRQIPSASGSAAGMVGSLAEGLDARSGAILREAFTYLGVPYLWAGNTRAGLDCSAFVKSVYAAQGVRLPRTAAEQARVGQSVGNNDDLLPGDRLYFDMGRKGRVSHCGIYIGNGLFIHASTNHGRVDVDPLSKTNYSRALVAVRR